MRCVLKILVLKLLSDWLTGVDGKTYDPARASLLSAVAVFLFLAVWTVVYLKQPWNAQDFGIGLGAILTGGGAGVALKAKTEPKGKDV